MIAAIYARKSTNRNIGDRGDREQKKMSSAADHYELPDLPVADDRSANAMAFVFFWLAIGLAVPAWSIGFPWGWFAYAAAVIGVSALMELRQLNNILVRTLPALRLALLEISRLNLADETRRKSTDPDRSE